MTENDYCDRHSYDDIIDLPHHVSAVRPHMPVSDRAAQFSPFAALTGYEEAVREAGRLTEKRIEIDEDEKNALDEKLRMIQERIEDHPEVTITYFRPDGRKEGGIYVTVRERAKRIDVHGKRLVMEDGMSIDIREIIKVLL